MAFCPPMTQSGDLLTMAQWPLAGVKDRNPDAHVFRASTKDTANFNLIYDRNQPTPVVDSVSDPLMPFGHVAEVDAAMPKRHGFLIAVIGKFADEFDRFARTDLLVDMAAAINSLGRFTSEFCYPGWVRLHAGFRKKGQRICPPLPLSGLWRHSPRPQQERMHCW